VHLGLGDGDLELTGRGSAEQVLALAASSAGGRCTELVLAPRGPILELSGDRAFERASRLFARSRRCSGAGRAILQQRHEG
jgi:hypothetical protein